VPKRRRTKGWQLGGPNAPRWLQAPATPTTKKNTRSDLEILKRILAPDELPMGHPLAVLWRTEGNDRARAEARFEFHHLASDLRTIEHVRGARDLVEAMKADMASYESYRYELRTAGSVGRSPGQTLLALGGKKQGPDIEVRTRSGHLAGIACYRASSSTSSMNQHDASQLVEMLGQAIAASPLFGHRFVMTLEFERFPISEESAKTAAQLFGELWNDHAGSAERKRTGPHGVKVSRNSYSRLPFDGLWETTVLLLMPVPAKEKHRHTLNIRDKLDAEQKQWAATYAGVPVLCVEESKFCLGLDRDELEPYLQADAPHAFQGIAATQQFFGEGKHGARHRLEQVDFFPRVPGCNLNLGFETFGDNMESFGDGHGVMSFLPKHAEEEWRLVSGAPPLGVAGTRVKPLTINRHFHRLPVPLGEKVTPEQLKPILAKMIPGFDERTP
jgi:hypothetical protein